MGSAKMVVDFKLLILFLFTHQGIALPTEKNPCPDLWIQGTWVGLGCLLFNTTQTYSWEEAFAYCQSENSALLEIQFEEQLDFLVMELEAIADHEGIAYHWWTAGTDLGKEGRWMWQGSLSHVPDFLWYNSSYPRNSTVYNCLALEPAWNYLGYDSICNDAYT